jgi:hypothetical protein
MPNLREKLAAQSISSQIGKREDAPFACVDGNRVQPLISLFDELKLNGDVDNIAY